MQDKTWTIHLFHLSLPIVHTSSQLLSRFLKEFIFPIVKALYISIHQLKMSWLLLVLLHKCFTRKKTNSKFIPLLPMQEPAVQIISIITFLLELIFYLISIPISSKKKFILHTNFPSHYDFFRYTKCNFQIKSSEANSQQIIIPDSKWDDVQRIFGKGGRPTIHTRPSNLNPFGATHFYGYRDIIFEIMSNNHIASVCLFLGKSST